jgi:hypothetical protein
VLKAELGGQQIPPTSIAATPSGTNKGANAVPVTHIGKDPKNASADTGTTQHAAAPAIKGEESSVSASKSGLPPAFKGEKGQEVSVDSRAIGGAVSKSESGELVELRKHVSDLESVVEAFLAAPLRKSMSGVSQLEYVSPRSTGSTSSPAQVSDRVQSLSKGEITAILSKKTAGPLSKADRQNINGWYEGTVDLKGIAHLLDS